MTQQNAAAVATEPDSPESDADSKAELPRFVRGAISGTNRGRITAKLKEKAGSIRADLLLWDFSYGPAIATYTGKRNGARLDLSLDRFDAPLASPPLFGNLTITFDDEAKTGDGQWKSDIGTSGVCRIGATTRIRTQWFVRRLSYWLLMKWYRHVPLAYSLALIGVAVASIFDLVRISWPALILLLLPAPVLFERRITAFVVGYRLKKAGPLEFDLLQPPAGNLLQMIGQLVDDRMQFMLLNMRLVPRTRLALAWIAENQPVSSANLEDFCKSIGVTGENFESTRDVLLASGCAIASDRGVEVTDLGLRYVQHLQQSPQLLKG